MATKKSTTPKKKTTTAKKITKKTKEMEIKELEQSAIENLVEKTKEMTNETDPEIAEAVKESDIMDLVYEVNKDGALSVTVTEEKKPSSVTEIKVEEVKGNNKEKTIYKKGFDYNSFWLTQV